MDHLGKVEVHDNGDGSAVIGREPLHVILLTSAKILPVEMDLLQLGHWYKHHAYLSLLFNAFLSAHYMSHLLLTIWAGWLVA